MLLGGAAIGLQQIAVYFDAETAARKQASIRYALSNHASAMAGATMVTAAEKDTLASLVDRDYARIHAMLGQPLGKQFGFEFVYVTDAAGKLVYSSEFGREGARTYFGLLTSALERLAHEVPPGGAGLAVAGPSRAAMLVLHVFRQTDPALQLPQPLRVYVGDMVDSELLGNIADAARTDSLQLVDKEPDDQPALQMTNLSGGAPFWLAWQGEDAKQELQSKFMLPLTMGASMCALLFFILMMRFRNLAEALKTKESYARELAQRDQLTRLSNREYFLSQFEQALEGTSDQRKVALFFIDLDSFKDINDTSGHTVGDEILREVGARLKTCIGLRGHAARFGGDEFVLFYIFDDAEQLEQLTQDIFSAIGHPIAVEDDELCVSVSIGRAYAPRDGQESGELLRRADIALYRAKAEGRDTCRAFEPRFEQEQQERRRVERELLIALEKKQLSLLYQPQVDVESEMVVGFEALVRWDHPTRGRIGPDEFIPIAERAGLIHLIDAYVLKLACKDAQALPGVMISVNMSPLDLRHPYIIENIRKTLQETDLDPARLELELTESAILDTSAESMEMLDRIRDLGICFALDDFGTGHASLVHVRRFPITKIKIDKSFIFNLGLQREAASIVEYVVRLGRSLGIILTAEGVETREQLRFLRAFGAHQAQGYLFAPPLPLPMAADLLKQQVESKTSPEWPISPALAAAAPGTADARASFGPGGEVRR